MEFFFFFCKINQFPQGGTQYIVIEYILILNIFLHVTQVLFKAVGVVAARGSLVVKALCYKPQGLRPDEVN
jgi:hypothetical protein